MPPFLTPLKRLNELENLDFNFSFVFRAFDGFFLDNLDYPLYKKGKKLISKLETVNVLLTPTRKERTCYSVPNNISQDVSFVIYCSMLASPGDWKCDDMGAWRNNGVKKFLFQHADGVVTAIEENGSPGIELQTYTLVCMYYTNKTSPDLKKFASYLEGIFINYNRTEILIFP